MELDTGQLEAIDRLKNGSILVGKVGSGKSRTALAYFFIKECGGSLKINNSGDYKPMIRPKDLYIITTAKKRDEKEWEREFVPFLLYPIDKAPMKITIDSWQNLPKHVNAMNSFFIFDEQRLVSYGKWTKSFLRISKNNRWISIQILQILETGIAYIVDIQSGRKLLSILILLGFANLEKKYM